MIPGGKIREEIGENGKIEQRIFERNENACKMVDLVEREDEK